MKPLRSKLDAALPPPLTELEHRRARTRLLEAAAERARPRTRPIVVLAAAFAIAGVLFFVHARHEPTKLVAVVAENVPPRQPAEPTPITTRAPEPTTPEGPPPAPIVHTAKAKPAVPGASFDKAFSDFEKSSYASADREFDVFLHEFPSDPRAEDAAYLRAVARYRLGDREAAAKLARSYLETYPSGLRRPEAERIAEAE